MPVNKPFILGLTGGIGCGKSMAAEYLKSLGAAHVDADAISRSLTAQNGPAIPAIREHFGEGVFAAEGILDRRQLGQVIFHDPEAKKALEAILHPMILDRMRKDIREAGECGAKVVILDVPLLFETGMESMCDEVWTMSVPEEVQLSRVCERDGLTMEAAAARVAGQMSMQDRNMRADRVIDSNRPFEETRTELSKLYHEAVQHAERW